MKLELIDLQENDLRQFIKDMQQAFQMGAEAAGDYRDEALPEEHIMEALNQKGSKAYKVMRDQEMVGGVILDFEEDGTTGYLVFLYVKAELEGQGIGKTIWNLIEMKYPNIKKWETFTPYSWKRNVHFYVNVCGFQVVEFFNARHTEDDPEHKGEEYFRFEKCIL